MSRSSSPTPITASAGAATVTAVTVKIPPFWPADPEMWCAQVDAQFTTKGISSQKTRRDTVSIDRLKPAHLDFYPTTATTTQVPPSPVTTSSTTSPTTDGEQTQLPPVSTTRSGRRVHFPDRLNL
uniref:DUF7041 domain-containing protein n=1 Tax=Amphimedon queenslandica TaxID=400682 RepID=A0A1X7VJT7_AMPQE